MSQFKVERGIALPNGSYKYPFREMQPGDSFLVPQKNISGAKTAARTFSKTNQDYKFTWRRLSEDAARVWRAR